MNLIDEVLRLDKEATNGPWQVWDGPEYVGGGADLCIGHGETWLTNMNERSHRDRNITIAQDFGPEPNEAEELEITREQRANADAIALYRTAAPKLARALKKAFDLLRSYRDRRTEFERITGESDHTVDRCENAMNICRQQRVDKILAEIEKELAA